MCDLKNIGQCQDVQRSQGRHFMANVNLYRSLTWAFFDSSRRFADIEYRNFVILKISVKVMMYNIRNGDIW